MYAYNEASLNDVRILAREIKRRCSEHGISVRFADGIDTAYSTPTSIVIPTIKMPVTPERLQLLRYYLIHEVGHHLRKEAFELLARAKITSKNLHSCWNMLEDEQLEREAQARHLGDRRSLVIGRELHIKDMLETWSEQSKGGTLKPSEDAVKAVSAHIVSCASRDWHDNVESLVENMLTVIGPETRALYNELASEGWIERIGASLDPTATRDLAYELHKRLWPTEEVQQNADEKGEGKQEDGDEKGEKRSKKGKGEPKDGEGRASGDAGGEPSEEKDKEAEEFTVPWDKIVGSEHSDAAPSGKLLHIDYSGFEGQGEARFIPDKNIKVKSPSPDAPAWGWCDTIEYKPDTSFANQMRRHIQSEARDRWETNRKTGRLNVRAIKRLKTGTKEHNRRIFKRRWDHEAINTCISVLVDWSGSMNGGRDNLAANAAGLLVDSFERVLRVPVEVLGHTHNHPNLIMVHAKQFGERVSGLDAVNRLKSVGQSGNADGDALLYAFERIQKRPEKRKIIIALADGQPTDCAPDASSAARNLQFAIEHVRKSNVELYGIGIQHADMKRWYGEDCSIVRDLSQLPRVLLEVAENFVLKR